MTAKQARLWFVFLIVSGLAYPQTGLISTDAGNGTAGFSGDGGAAASATVSHPIGLALDASGNLYIADLGNSRIRQVNAATGVISTFAGSGYGGFGGDGGPATAALLYYPFDAKLDAAGNLYLSDGGNNRIRRVAAVSGIITTIAGTGAAGFSGDGGAATGAALNFPAGLAIDSAGDIYFADSSNNRIRRIDAGTGIVTTVAGNGTGAYSGDGGPATAASLNYPAAIAFDSSGNLYVAEAGSPIFSASSGGGGGGGAPPVPANHIRRIDAVTGIITTVAGTGSPTFNGDGIPATSANISAPLGLSVDASGNLVFADLANNRTRMVAASTGLIWTIAGNGSAPSGCCSIGDGGQATSALLSAPAGLAISSLNPIFVSEEQGNRVRKVALPSPYTTTALTLSASATSVASGSPITLTASISAINALGSSASGGVEFIDTTTSTMLGAAMVTNGSASLTASFSLVKTHTITAMYSGDSSFGSSFSPVLSLTVTAGLAPSSVTLSTNAPNPVPGQTVTFTANVSPATATGSVQFMDNGTSLGTAAVASGVATLSSSALTQGSNSITAVYSGDSATAGSTSSPLSLSVKASVSLSLVSSANPSTVGQTVTFTITITPSAATGTVQILDNGTAIGTATLASGVATFSTSTLTQGTHPISLAYSGDANYMSASTSTWPQVVKAVSSVTVASSLNPSNAGQQVTFTASVTPSTATGTVQFLDGGAVIGTVAVASGVATLATSTLTSGAHTITASYGGDSNFATATSTAITQTVLVISSITIWTNAPNPVPGQTVTFTANVTPATATGTVQFIDNGTVMGTATIASGVATLSTSALTQGANSITAVYGGDSLNAGSTSAILSLSVKASDSLSLISSANPSTVGQTVTFTITITPSAATGTVQILDNGTAIGTATLASGVATFSTSTLTQGTHPISLLYSGDANYMSASTSTWPQIVKAVSSVTVVSSLNPSNAGQSVTFTAAVTPSSATGTVQFLDGGAVIGTAAVASGVVAFSTSTLASGTHTITASYGGDSNFAPATATAMTQTVKAISSVVVASNTNPSVVQQVVTFTAAVTPSTATGTVQFLDNGTVIGTGAAVSGAAAFSTAGLAQGTHTITAVYSGDSNFAGATSAALSQTVKATALVGLSTNTPNPVPGQTVTFTASVTPSTATGTVQFVDNGSVIGTSALSSGAASFSTSSLALGSHSVTAVYSGDSNDTSGTSGAVVFSVKAPSSLTVSSNLNPSTVGQTATFTARVSPATATGSVQFLDSGSVIGTSSLASGAATFSTSTLAQGTHSISVVYSGDANDLSAASSAIVQTVKANSSVAVASSENPSTVGQAVTFTATIAPSTSTGTVQFLNGGTVLGTVTVSNGSASVTTTALTAGAHSIQAVYSGDAVTNGSSSSVLSQTVKTATTVTLTSNENPASHTATVTFKAKVSPTAATGTVQFFDGSTLLGTEDLSGGSASLSVKKMTTGTHAIQAVYSGDANYAGGSAVLDEKIN